MVSPKVMDEASIVPEEISENSEKPSESVDDSSTVEFTDSSKVSLNEDRLSIFEEYFEKKTDDTPSKSDKKDESDQDEDEHPEED